MSPLGNGTYGNVGICVPTCNAGEDFACFLEALRGVRGVHRMLAIDSSSTDGTAQRARDAGFEVVVIPAAEFDHGGTRQKGVELLDDCEVLVFLTQDCFLESPASLVPLLNAFSDPKVGAAFGRQLPRLGAGALEACARDFGYPETSRIKVWPEAKSLGIMAGAISNSFAAYRREALLEQGGFPQGAVCSEDVYVGFKILFGGWKIAYVAESRAYHSHDYTPLQELRRYFDIGAFYGAFEPWIVQAIGRAESRGARFLIVQLLHVARKEPWNLWKVPLSAAAKYLGYRLGDHCRSLPKGWCVWLGMNKAFWRRWASAGS